MKMYISQLVSSHVIIVSMPYHHFKKPFCGDDTNNV